MEKLCSLKEGARLRDVYPRIVVYRSNYWILLCLIFW